MPRFIKPFVWVALFFVSAGWKALDFLGRADVLLHFPTFALHLKEFMLQHQEAGYLIAPWFVMALSVFAFVQTVWPNLLRWQRSAPALSPASPTATSLPTYLTAYESVHYMADESEWGYGQEAAQALLNAPSEFKERASEGKIRVYGASPTTGQHEQIPKTHWMSHAFDLSTVYQPEANCKTVPATYQASLSETPTGYSDLKVVAEDVSQVWPRSQQAEFADAFRLAAMSKDDAVAELWKLRRIGVAIRNERLASDKDWPTWNKKYEKWRNDVLQVAEKFDVNFKHRLEVLDQLRPPPHLPTVNHQHAQGIAIMSEILLRLEHRLP